MCLKYLHKNPSILLAKQVFAYLDHCTKSQANLDYFASSAWDPTCSLGAGYERVINYSRRHLQTGYFFLIYLNRKFCV